MRTRKDNQLTLHACLLMILYENKKERTVKESREEGMEKKE